MNPGPEQAEERLERLVADALALAPAERAAFLAAACGDELALLEEARARVGLPAAAPRGDESPVRLDLGTTVAGERAYRIKGELGRGGMGVVYLAERRDADFAQEVALKVMRQDLLAGDNERRRFATERRVLSSLDHPHIARLLDGGTTAEGLPFLVMELVRGTSIDRYCEAEAVTVRERVRLMRQVAVAVQHAHQRLVVHRDLKPSNILVTPDGMPKLLDFGIAKLLREDQSGAALTTTGHAALTPRYSSPEQLSGAPVTTASDVYSLGVVLYELLAGRHPFAEYTDSLPRLALAICDTEPLRPSLAAQRRDGVGTAPAPAELRGDLDAIVLKAMRKEPELRYASAEQLAEDLDCYLDGRPVTARRGTATYRAGKFVRRHWLSTSFAVLFVATLAGFGAQARWQAVRIAGERDRAERVTGLLVGLFQSADPEGESGRRITAQEILERGAERVRREPALDPAARCALHCAIGEALSGLGLYESAATVLGEAVAAAREAGDQDELAMALSSLGQALRLDGRYDAAEEALREALAILRARQPGAQLAVCLARLGGVLHDAGDLDAAEPVYLEARTVAERLDPPDPAVLGDAMDSLGSVYQDRGDLDRAAALYRDGLELRRRAYGSSHPLVARSLNNLATAVKDQGRYAEAEPLYREALATYRELLGEQHPMVPLALDNLAGLLRSEGRYAEAEELQEQAVARWSELRGEADVDTAIARNNLGFLRLLQGDPLRAEAQLGAAWQTLRELLGDDHPTSAIVRANLARALLERGLLAESREHVEASCAVLRRAFGERNPRVATLLWLDGRITALEGDLAAARRLQEEALAIRREALGADHPDVAQSLVELAHLARDTGDVEDARRQLREALAILRVALPSGHPSIAAVEAELGSPADGR